MVCFRIYLMEASIKQKLYNFCNSDQFMCPLMWAQHLWPQLICWPEGIYFSVEYRTKLKTKPKLLIAENTFENLEEEVIEWIKTEILSEFVSRAELADPFQGFPVHSIVLFLYFDWKFEVKYWLYYKFEPFGAKSDYF